MKLLSVIPILKGVAPEILSYYAANDVSPGALVLISVRNRSVPALVTRSEDASKNKAVIRTAGFALKKIEKVITNQCFSPAFIDALADIAEKHTANLGPVIASLFPTGILERAEEAFPDVPEISHTDARPPRPESIQASFNERVRRYRALARESLARGRSAIILTPTSVEAKIVYDAISKGIEDRVYRIDSTLSKKKLIAAWREALENPESIVAVVSASCAALPRHDIGLYIVEHESSSRYKLRTRPFVDMRIAARVFAERAEAGIVWGDSLLRVETLAELLDEHTDGLRASLTRAMRGTAEIIDMRDAPDTRAGKPVLSNDALEALRHQSALGEKSFIYTLRKGHSSFTVCRDCGLVLICSSCSAPMVLHLGTAGDPEARNGEDRMFLCHRCGEKRDTNTVCSGCGGWRLEMYGVGVERVAEYLEQEIPGVPTFIMSADTAKTPAALERIATAWKASDGGILIGTDSALPFIESNPLSVVVVASIDTLLSLPDIGMQERAARLIMTLRDSAERVYVHTRNPEARAFAYATAEKGGLELYQQEIKTRRALAYPPASILIKITRRGAEADVLRDLEKIAATVKPYETLVYPAFIARERGLFAAHALITVPKNEWPAETLGTYLRALPPHFAVDVAPESIL